MKLFIKQLHMRSDTTGMRIVLPDELLTDAGISKGSIVRVGSQIDTFIIKKSESNIGVALEKSGRLNLPQRFTDKYRTREHEYIAMWSKQDKIYFKLISKDIEKIINIS